MPADGGAATQAAAAVTAVIVAAARREVAGQGDCPAGLAVVAEALRRGVAGGAAAGAGGCGGAIGGAGGGAGGGGAGVVDPPGKEMVNELCKKMAKERCTRLCKAVIAQVRLFAPAAAALLSGTHTAFVSCFPPPSRLRHRLCLVSPPPSRLRQTPLLNG